MLSDKEWITIASVLWSTFLIGVYVRSIFKQGVKPHLFSWIIWGVDCVVVGFAQMAAHGGIGAWTTLYAGVTFLGVAGLAIKYGDKHVTRGDKVMLAVALLAIPLWLITDNPLMAVLLETLIDVVGFGPTFVKSWRRPNEENAFVFSMGASSNILKAAAIEQYSVTTLLYPVWSILGNTIVAVILLGRRWYKARHQ